MFTSYFANLQNIPSHLEPVGIARGTPRGFRGRSVKSLAPTWKMLKLPREDYDLQFDAMLSQLDPATIAEELGENAVLLCWERPHTWCHRRRVGEWLEAALGIEIPELGFERSQCPAYAELPAAKK